MNLTNASPSQPAETPDVAKVLKLPNNKKDEYTPTHHMGVVNVSLKKDLVICAFVEVNGGQCAHSLTSHLETRLQKKPLSKPEVSLTSLRTL